MTLHGHRMSGVREDARHVSSRDILSALSTPGQFATHPGQKVTPRCTDDSTSVPSSACGSCPINYDRLDAT